MKQELEEVLPKGNHEPCARRVRPDEASLACPANGRVCLRDADPKRLCQQFAKPETRRPRARCQTSEPSWRLYELPFSHVHLPLPFNVRYEGEVSVRDEFKGQKASGEFNRGVALSVEEKEEEALAAFEAALVLEPTHVGAMAGKGRALAWLGRTRAALEAFTEASRLDPDDAEHLLQAGLCMLELGLVGRAQAALGRASRSDDDRHACAARVLDVARSFMVRAERWRDRGVPKQEAVGYQLGEACFRIALGLWPRSAEAARGLSLAASSLGKKDEAIRWAQLADSLMKVN